MGRSRPTKLSPPSPFPSPRPGVRWGALGLAVALLAAVAVLERLAGAQTTFAFFYLVPIAVATWFCGASLGLLFCFVSAGITLAEQLGLPRPVAITAWNTGNWLGTFLTVWALLRLIRLRGLHLPLPPLPRRLAWAAVLVGAGLLGCGGVFAYRSMAGDRLSGREASAALVDIARDVRACVQGSRPVLLGSRDLKGPSCVQIVKTGQIQDSLPMDTADLDGGPGMRILVLAKGPVARAKNAREEYDWHQGRLKTVLENILASNAEPLRQASDLARETLAFSQRVSEWTSLPDNLDPAETLSGGDWLSVCLAAVNETVARRDLPGLHRWAAEMASAAFALEDLHRWLGFLAENHLTALEFQAKCESLFTWASPRMPDYDLASSLSSFPAGLLLMHGIGNYIEVERQAEDLFRVPLAQLEAVRSARGQGPDAVWMPPRLRELFLQLGQPLSPANRQTWEQAARTPFEHSYLVNMLFRAANGQMVEPLGAALQRFNANSPEATMAEMMGFLMYRGHSFGGIEWADRYQPQMMSDAAQVTGTDAEALAAAHKHVHGFFRLAEYTATLTLRQALDQRRLDCVRATDMLVDILRNSGRGRLGHVRWTAGTAAHSVAALFTYDGNQLRTLLADGMTPSDQPEQWPNAYFQGHAWPAGLESNPPPYAAELYVRGLDNYVWAEGYIIRDQNAGTLMKAGIPYLPRREEKSSQKVYDPPAPAATGETR